MTQKSRDLTPIAGGGMSPINILENGCKRLDASLDDVECCVWRDLHKRGTIGSEFRIRHRFMILRQQLWKI